MSKQFTCLYDGKIKFTEKGVEVSNWCFGVLEVKNYNLELSPYIYIGGDCSDAVLSINKIWH
jgi:hypothetical protein